MKKGFLLSALLALTPAVGAEGQLIGLLSLPNVFGAGPCARFAPKEIALYAAPDSQPAVGSIRVEKNWTFSQEGGCEGLIVKVHLFDSPGSSELPTREYGYEEPGALVLEQRGRWFRVRLAEGSAWLGASEAGEYFPLERLLADGLTHLTEAFDGRLASSPGAGRRAMASGPPPIGQSVQVREIRRVGDQLWIHVAILSEPACGSTETPSVTEQGWIPAYASSGEPTVWFSSRGC